MSAAAKALWIEGFKALTGEERRQIAQMFADYLTPPATTKDRWMHTAEAAEYLGMSPKALRRRMERRNMDSNPIPVTQERFGGKYWFKLSELDAWRKGER